MSRPLPSFLKRPGKRDSSSTHGSSMRSASFSSSSTSSIRFSNLGDDDEDFFSVSTRSSPPTITTPVEEREDQEEAEEAIVADYSPMSGLDDAVISLEGDSEAERVQSLGECLIRQASMSSPPDFVNLPTDDLIEEEPPKKKEIPVLDQKTATNLLQDLDEMFESVPKPQKKPKKKTSDYVKPKSIPRPTVLLEKRDPIFQSLEKQESDSSSQSLDKVDDSLDKQDPSASLQSIEKKRTISLSQSLPASRTTDSIFDAADDLLDPAPSPRPRRTASFDSPPTPSPKPAPPIVDKAPLMPGLHAQSFSDSPAPTDTPDASPSLSLTDIRLCVPVLLVLSLIFLRLLPSTAFFMGFIWGAAIALGCAQLYRLLTTRSEPLAKIGQAPDLSTLPPPTIPQVDDEPDDGGGVFRGWMNELGQYKSDSYHINQTCSVFVSLDGTQLRIQRPKQNVQKRAMWNENLPHRQIAFIHQRHFDMMGVRVLLEPSGLVKKRVWSKKYPIVLQFGTASNAPPPKKHAGDFEWVEPDDERLYLFARTCREKEEWFRRFEAAARGKPLQLSLKRLVETYLETDGSSAFAPQGDGDSTLTDSASVSFSASHAESASIAPDIQLTTRGVADSQEWTDRLQGSEREPLTVTYTRYMARFMPADWLLRAAKSHRLDINHVRCEPQMLWINAFLGRGVWDLLREKFWADKVKQKIQNKLRKIHLPYFIDELTVVEIALGKCFPVIRRAGKPFLNSRGLWVELDIWYSGGGSMALVTKINLMKLRKRRTDPGEGKSESTAHSPRPESSHTRRNNPKNGACCSEEEDSAESTTDSELDENPDSEIVTDPDKGNHIGGGTSRKLLRFVDRIARSSYFHKAIENSKIIQRGMEYVSNTPIELHVEVKFLSGTLLVNIPPPPTDRLWYGFKPTPNLVITARPKVGEKELTMARLTEWIEKKLLIEFQRVFVMPNMDDLVIPLLLSGNPETVGHPEGGIPCS